MNSAWKKNLVLLGGYDTYDTITYDTVPIYRRSRAPYNTITGNMSNIHGLHSIRNNNTAPRPSGGSDDEEDRYVGGVDSRGGGSGLA